MSPSWTKTHQRTIQAGRRISRKQATDEHSLKAVVKIGNEINIDKTVQEVPNKSESIPIAGCGGLLSCEMFRISDNRPTDGGKVVSPMHRPRSTPQKHRLPASGTDFC
jgi:hypothetical protein